MDHGLNPTSGNDIELIAGRMEFVTTQETLGHELHVGAAMWVTMTERDGGTVASKWRILGKGIRAQGKKTHHEHITNPEVQPSEPLAKFGARLQVESFFMQNWRGF